MKKAKGTKYKTVLPFAFCCYSMCRDAGGYASGRSFSPLARAFWHSGQRYSNSELLSESTSLWIIRAYRNRVALLHLAQLTYVSEMAVRRVPRTSSCMADTYLSTLLWGYTIALPLQTRHNSIEHRVRASPCRRGTRLTTDTDSTLGTSFVGPTVLIMARGAENCKSV